MIIKKEFIHEDNICDLSSSLFQLRRQKGLSLKEVSLRTNIPQDEIDNLEISQNDINFDTLAILLDFYEQKLPEFTNAFPFLPKEYIERYFI